MNCEECEQSIYPYLDGELTPSEREAFEEALESCAHCRELLQQAENIRAAMAVGADGPGLPEVRREAILAAAQKKAGGGANDKPEDDNILPFPFRAVGLGLAAAVFATAVFGFWLLQSDWERPEFDRVTGEQSSVAQMEAEESEQTGERAARSSTEDGEAPAEAGAAAEEGEPPTEIRGAGATPPAGAAPQGEPEQQVADSGAETSRGAPREAEPSMRSAVTSEQSSDGPSPLAQQRARRADEPVRREAVRPQSSAGAIAELESGSASDSEQAEDREIGTLEGQAVGSSDSFGTSANDNVQARRSASETRGESAGTAGSGGASASPAAEAQEPAPSAPARSASGAESEAAAGLAADERVADLAEAEEESQQELRPAQETFAVIRSNIEAGEHQRAIELGLAVEDSRDLSASERSELYYLIATAHRRRGDTRNARRFFEQAVEASSESAFGRAAYQELQELGD